MGRHICPRVEVRERTPRKGRGRTRSFPRHPVTSGREESMGDPDGLSEETPPLLQSCRWGHQHARYFHSNSCFASYFHSNSCLLVYMQQ